MDKLLVFLSLFAILLIAGCTGKGDSTGPAEGEQQGAAQKGQLASTISPARDLTGTWAGSAIYQDNAVNPNCKYEGGFVFNFQQQGNNIQGTYSLTITKSNQLLDTGLPCSPPGQYPAAAIIGTVSSSRIDFTDTSNDIFSGTFTTDLMTLNFESCPNNKCTDGSYGVGVKGTAKLTRQ